MRELAMAGCPFGSALAEPGGAGSELAHGDGLCLTGKMAQHSSNRRRISSLSDSPVSEATGLMRGVATLPTVLLPGGPPRGDSGPVRVLPGYQTGDWSTFAIRAYLSGLGYRTSGWGLGTNRGDVTKYADVMAEVVSSDAERFDRPVRLVGWSLGGTISREVARRVPGAVQQVVTLGSPVMVGRHSTAQARNPIERGWQMAANKSAATGGGTHQSSVPITALFSKSDKVVAWQACQDPDLDSNTKHIEVRGAHFELGVSAPVLRLVGRILAED
jgi:pimeloyl-ACP methyl ester carboxylesterase